jgi:hypothetical protein
VRDDERNMLFKPTTSVSASICGVIVILFIGPQLNSVKHRNRLSHDLAKFPTRTVAKRPPLSQPAATDQEFEQGHRVEGLGHFGKPAGELGTNGMTMGARDSNDRSRKLSTQIMKRPSRRTCQTSMVPNSLPYRRVQSAPRSLYGLGYLTVFLGRQ